MKRSEKRLGCSEISFPHGLNLKWGIVSIIKCNGAANWPRGKIRRLGYFLQQSITRLISKSTTFLLTLANITMFFNLIWFYKISNYIRCIGSWGLFQLGKYQLRVVSVGEECRSRIVSKILTEWYFLYFRKF